MRFITELGGVTADKGHYKFAYYVSPVQILEYISKLRAGDSVAPAPRSTEEIIRSILPTPAHQKTCWGKSVGGKKVHLYLNGVMVCHSNGLGLDHIDGEMPFDRWDIDDPDTCPKCRSWALLVRKGFEIKPIHSHSAPFTATS